MFDSKITNPCFELNDNNKLVPIKDKKINLNEDYCNIVQAKIIINKDKSSIKEHQTILYAYYPVEISLSMQYLELTSAIDGGFSQVIYASDGTNPAWDSAEPFICNLNALSEDIRNYFQIDWSYQNHLHIAPEFKNINSPMGQLNIAPDNKYNDGNSKNFVKAFISLTSPPGFLFAITAQFSIPETEEMFASISESSIR
jgi:hypothetical protein